MKEFYNISGLVTRTMVEVTLDLRVAREGAVISVERNAEILTTVAEGKGFLPAMIIIIKSTSIAPLTG